MAGYVLLVDDDDGIRDALSLLLSDEGIRHRAAVNGREALDLLQVAGEPPALILLDVMMPVMDGFAFRRAQRADPRLADIPVLVLSAGLLDDRVQALEADGYLQKPLELDTLLRRLRRWLD